MTRGGRGVGFGGRRLWGFMALGFLAAFLLGIYPGSRVLGAEASDNDVFLHAIFRRKNSTVPLLEAQNTGRTEAYTP